MEVTDDRPEKFRANCIIACWTAMRRGFPDMPSVFSITIWPLAKARSGGGTIDANAPTVSENIRPMQSTIAPPGFTSGARHERVFGSSADARSDERKTQQ